GVQTCALPISPMRAESTTRQAAEKGSSELFAPPAAGNPPQCSGQDIERRLRRAEAGEEGRGGNAEMACGGFREERAEVGGHREVAALEELMEGEPRPLSVDAAAAHGAAQHEHRRPVTVGW